MTSEVMNAASPTRVVIEFTAGDLHTALVAISAGLDCYHELSADGEYHTAIKEYLITGNLPDVLRLQIPN